MECDEGTRGDLDPTLDNYDNSVSAPVIVICTTDRTPSMYAMRSRGKLLADRSVRHTVVAKERRWHTSCEGSSLVMLACYISVMRRALGSRI